MSDAAIRIQQVAKHFGPTRALDGVSFDIPLTGVFGLLGPNGAGKTTLFGIMAGFLKPTHGKIEVLGVNVEQISALRGRLSILPQDAKFQANIPIIDQIVFFSMLNGNTRHDAEKEAARALHIVGLADVARKSARILSHGMYKRLGIAQAFLGSPEVILLDEPTAGLDPASAHAIRQLIDSIRTTATLVVSSHDLREIQNMCDAVAILDRGKLVECSSVADITQADTVTRITFNRPLTKEEWDSITGISGISSIEQDGPQSYKIHMDPELADGRQIEITSQVNLKVASGGNFFRSVQDGISLESRFLDVTQAPIPQQGDGQPSS